MKLGDAFLKPVREFVVTHLNPQLVQFIRRLASIDPERREIGIPVVPLQIQPGETLVCTPFECRRGVLVGGGEPIGLIRLKIVVGLAVLRNSS